jgi:hypothetical protein
MNQDLMNIFIKYQIPSDLISYAPNEEKEETRYLFFFLSFFFVCFVWLVGCFLIFNLTFSFEKIEKVKQHMRAMQQMIEGKKEEEVIAKAEEAVYASLPTTTLPTPTKKSILAPRSPRTKTKFEASPIVNSCVATNAISFSSMSPSPVPFSPSPSVQSPPTGSKSASVQSPRGGSGGPPSPSPMIMPSPHSSAPSKSLQTASPSMAQERKESAPPMKKATNSLLLPTTQANTTQSSSTTTTQPQAKPVQAEASKPATESKQERRIEKGSSSASRAPVV